MPIVEQKTLLGLKTFGLLLLKTRADKGWSQRELTRQAGLGSDRTIANWEKNAIYPVQEPSPGNLRKVAPLIHNPLTGQPFTFMELFQVCQGDLKIPADYFKDIPEANLGGA